jgi:transposase
MDVVVQRCCGLDVHKDTVVACVRTPGKGGHRDQQTRTFGTMTRDLLALRDWLVAMGVTLVGMESTGVYWKPAYYLLEDAMECWLLNARHLRNVPGKKTDVLDAEWICQLVEHGLVRPSFVPPRPIRELRDLTRYRKAQIEERGREAQRLDKVLQDAGLKLSSVATDILGRSGRDMLEALVRGTRDPEVLADLARGRLRAKLPALREALTGRFAAHHALLVGEILAKLDYLDEAIGRLSTEVDRLISPFAPELALLDTIPGVDRRTAEAIVAEIGADMARFGSSGRLASWAGLCPGLDESAGKRRSGRTRKGSKWLGTALAEAAESAGRSKGTYLGAQFSRLRGRLGHAKARKAVAHSILVAAFHVLDRHVPYADLGADWFVKRRPEAHARRLARQIEALGYRVNLEPLEAA